MQVDLRVRGREPGPLREREDERERRERRDEESVARSQGGEDTVPPFMLRRLRVIAAVALLALPVLVAFGRGGYFDAARLRAGIAACLLAAIAAALSPLPRGTAARVAIGGLAALTAWSALSLTWAPLAGPAVDDIERNVLYLAALVAAATLLTAAWTEWALLAGIVATAAYGLSERLLPGLFELERSTAAADRLAQPLTYWNAQGALAALGLVLAAGLIARAARRTTPTAVRALAGAAIPVLGLDLYLTLSRGALGALVAGLLVLVALLPTRAGVLAALLAAAGTALPAVLAETALSGVMRADAEAGAGAAMLAVLALAGAACALAATRIDAATVVPRLRVAAVAALVAALAVTVLSVRSGTPTTGSERLVSAQSNRYDYWRVAAGTFADHPLDGVGSGSFRVEWLLRRDRDESVRDAHSLYLETAAELGIVGLAALAALFGGVIAAARRARAPAAAAALAAWAVHAGIDWDWELPGITLFAVLLAGRLLAAAEQEPAATAASPPAAAVVPTRTSSPPTPAP